MKRKIKLRWSCSDYVHHQHKYRWTAIICGYIQRLWPYRTVRLREITKKYNELLYAVQTKFPDETRHQTALRYILAAENRDCSEAQCQKGVE